MNHSFGMNEDTRRNMETFVCPKPQSHQLDTNESMAIRDLLDIFYPKGALHVEHSYSQVPSSPPFFSGSPPSRVSNPQIRDARFGDKFFSISPHSIHVPSSLSSSTPSSSPMGGAVRSRFGNNPAVIIEGFDCLHRDNQTCRITALALR